MSPALGGTPRHAFMAVAAYVLALLATVGWGAVFSTRNDDLRGEMERKGRLLAELKRRIAAQGPGSPGAGRTPAAGATISASTETIAASELQKRILVLLESAGGAVQSVQAEPVKDAAAEGLRKLVAQLVFDSTIAELQRLLFDLETGAPLMFVDVLAVQPAPASVPGTRPGVTLRVNLSVTSYWLPTEQRKSAGEP